MKGSYALILENSEDSDIVIGALGKKHFKRGRYIYVGSAFGQNQSIQRRVNRHVELFFSGKGSVHWHIDYLLTSDKFELKGYNEFPSSQRNECKIANEIKKDSNEEIKGFGCSDCSCESHLFYREEH